MISLVVQKPFSFMETHFSIFAFVAWDLGTMSSPGQLCCDMVYEVTPLLILRNRAPQELSRSPCPPAWAESGPWLYPGSQNPWEHWPQSLPLPQNTDLVPSSAAKGPHGQICGCSCLEMSTYCVLSNAGFFWNPPATERTLVKKTLLNLKNNFNIFWSVLQVHRALILILKSFCL